MDFEKLSHIDEKIDEVEIYRYDSDIPRHFSHGTWWNRQHAFLKVSSNGMPGWGENRVSFNNVNVNIAFWARCFGELKGLSVSEAIEHVRSKYDDWGERRCEMAEMALIDLAGRVKGVASLKLLGLLNRGTVPGIFCILESDPRRVREIAIRALQKGYSSHVKVKLFGDNRLDVEVVKEAREVLGDKAFIVGDVNGGYRVHYTEEPLEGIAASMEKLYKAGLNACEDPAEMSTDQWIRLQEMVGELKLLPDAPMRPAKAAMDRIAPEMGKIFNIHPGCSGSIIDSVLLAEKVKSMGATLMLGDDSLMGPACTAWQQIAVGMGADWVEALEKTGDSDAFHVCVKRQATCLQADGRIALNNISPGFGIEIDESILKEKSKEFVKL